MELYLKETVGEHSEEELKSIILNNEKDDFLGSGNGVDIAKSINTYVLHQVNIFLKAPLFNAKKTECSTLTSNSMINCGPGAF